MYLDKLLLNISKYRLIWAGSFLDLLNLILGTCTGYFLDSKGWKFTLIFTIPAYPIYSYAYYKHKRAISQKVLLGESYKSQFNTLMTTLNRFLESTEEQGVAQAFYDKLIEDSMVPILEELGLIHDPKIRVSLFSRSKEGFILTYRHADDPEFKKKGRTIYPDDEGVIGKAYHKNEGYIQNMPDPIYNKPKWIEEQLSALKGNMKTKIAVNNLTMASRNYYALPFRCGLDKPIIIVFESMEGDQLKKKEIKKLIETSHGLRLQEVLSMYRMHIEPSLGYAKKMGM